LGRSISFCGAEVELGKLETIFTADDRSLQAAFTHADGGFKSLRDTANAVLKEITGSLSGLASPLSVAAAGFTALIGAGVGLFELSKRVSEVENKMFSLSEKTGFAVSTLSALDVAAKRNDSSVEKLSSSLGIFDKNLSKANNSTGATSALIHSLNLDLTSNEKALSQVFTKLNQMADGGNKTAIALTLFGRAGKDVLAVIKESGGNLDAYKAKLQELGILMTGEQARAGHEFTVQMQELSQTFQGLTRDIATDVMPMFLKGMKDLADFLRENKDGIVGGIAAIGHAIDWLLIKPAEGWLLGLGKLESTAQRVKGMLFPKDATGGDISRAAMSALNLTEQVTGNGTEAPALPKGGAEKDQLRVYKDILKSITDQLVQLEDASGAAGLEQKFLDAGINKLTGSLKTQAEAIKATTFSIYAQVTATKAAKEAQDAAKAAADALNGQLDSANERIFDLTAKTEGGRTALERFDYWLKNLKNSSTLSAEAIAKTRKAMVDLDAATVDADRRAQTRRQGKTAVDSIFSLGAGLDRREAATQLDKLYQQVSQLAGVNIEASKFAPLTDFLQAVGDEPSRLAALAVLDKIFKDISTDLDPRQLQLFKEGLVDAAISAKKLDDALAQKTASEKFSQIIDELNNQLIQNNKLTERQITLQKLAVEGLDAKDPRALKAISIADAIDKQNDKEKAHQKFKEIADDLRYTIGGALDSLANDGWKGFLDSLLNSFKRFLTDLATELLTSSIFGKGKSTAGGLVGFLTNAIFGALGGGLSKGSSSGGGVWNQNDFPGLATGGDAKGWTWVGERGRELAYFGGNGGHVLSNPDSEKIAGTTNVFNTINVPVSRSSGYTQRKSRRQLASEIVRGIA
jgi:hypothetical protein